jgi:hypothetical protein
VAWVRPAGDGALQTRVPQMVASNRPLCLYADGLWSDALTMVTDSARSSRREVFICWGRQ